MVPTGTRRSPEAQKRWEEERRKERDESLEQRGEVWPGDQPASSSSSSSSSSFSAVVNVGESGKGLGGENRGENGQGGEGGERPDHRGNPSSSSFSSSSPFPSSPSSSSFLSHSSFSTPSASPSSALFLSFPSSSAAVGVPAYDRAGGEGRATPVTRQPGPSPHPTRLDSFSSCRCCAGGKGGLRIGPSPHPTRTRNSMHADREIHDAMHTSPPLLQPVIYPLYFCHSPSSPLPPSPPTPLTFPGDSEETAPRPSPLLCKEEGDHLAPQPTERKKKKRGARRRRRCSECGEMLGREGCGIFFCGVYGNRKREGNRGIERVTLSAVRGRKGNKEYEVRKKGEEGTVWLPKASVSKDLVARFWAFRGQKSGKSAEEGEMKKIMDTRGSRKDRQCSVKRKGKGRPYWVPAEKVPKNLIATFWQKKRTVRAPPLSDTPPSSTSSDSSSDSLFHVSSSCTHDSSSFFISSYSSALSSFFTPSSSSSSSPPPFPHASHSRSVKRKAKRRQLVVTTLNVGSLKSRISNGALSRCCAGGKGGLRIGPSPHPTRTRNSMHADREIHDAMHTSPPLLQPVIYPLYFCHSPSSPLPPSPPTPLTFPGDSEETAPRPSPLLCKEEGDHLAPQPTERKKKKRGARRRRRCSECGEMLGREGCGIFFCGVYGNRKREGNRGIERVTLSAVRGRKGNKEYEVRKKGEEGTVWLPKASVSKDLVARFWAFRGQKSGKSAEEGEMKKIMDTRGSRKDRQCSVKRKGKGRPYWVPAEKVPKNLIATFWQKKRTVRAPPLSDTPPSSTSSDSSSDSLFHVSSSCTHDSSSFFISSYSSALSSFFTPSSSSSSSPPPFPHASHSRSVKRKAKRRQLVVTTLNVGSLKSRISNGALSSRWAEAYERDSQYQSGGVFEKSFPCAIGFASSTVGMPQEGGA
uniref:Uncharacterized protein n=1 Tax=Chromera velia CCMP2878 TaxID=1169474 RepID=A0A0K6SAN6_9ALVE|eukprot:Cvel_11502.t1-p1 / transcript=Cvel_11502.t1 / gene=Cvel_11502 / organism=Chromera_velia_CCMP2878 / gene_product=hypothetical protein / transcript_product=hypothetical protein / location=Cvel_scaffold725:34061-40768(+) / protein_length=917 / sequence_SO=supercontig / SO=protein_coding / is_pseudo=false